VLRRRFRALHSLENILLPPLEKADNAESLDIDPTDLLACSTWRLALQALPHCRSVCHLGAGGVNLDLGSVVKHSKSNQT
jgi:hypothetical protein